MSSDAPIIQKVYDFYREFYTVNLTMPKQDRYGVGEKIQAASLELLESLIFASHAGKQHKSSHLTKAAAKLDLLRTLVRLSEDVRAVPTKKYLILSEQLQETGRMLGGWIRSLGY